MITKGQQTAVVENAVVEACFEKFGDLRNEVDLLLLLLPTGTITAGTEEWKAFGYMSSWISVYNDEYTYPGIFMHEIGHNIGLLHSHDEVSYGDGSCLMGSSPAKLDGPRICFNGAKSWQLNWYQEKHLTLHAEDIADESHNLASITDYDMSPENEYLIIKVTGTAVKFDFFVTFNRRKGITIDNTEGDNMIMITKVPASSYGDSHLVARLGVGGEFVAKVLIDGNYIAINYESLQVEKSPISATARFSRYFKCRSDLDCDDFDPCSTSTCSNYDRYGEGVCSYSYLPCYSCGTNINVTLLTNQFPDEVSWKIERNDKNRIIMKSETGLTPDTSHSQSKCLAYGSYTFALNYEQNSTLVTNVSYSLKAADGVIFDGSTYDYIFLKEEFTVCKSDSDCLDYDGCSTDVCNQETNICENVAKNEADYTNCKWVSVEIITDNYEEETSWYLAAIVGRQEISVLSGK